MVNYKICNPNYSFVMAPFYLVNDDELFRSQLINLSYQTDKDFEVIIPDPHYNKRKWLGEYIKNFNFNVVHFPYISNLKTPKSFDYGIFNNAVLMAKTNKIITFQDWRFCHPKLIKILKQVKDFQFVGFTWQVLYRNDSTIRSKYHTESTVAISPDDAEKMYSTGFFPELGWESERVYTFHNPSWGHYCIDKNLWLAVNGIDEVATNTRHYADLDLNARLEEYYARNNKKIEIPMIKNVMTRIMHNKGQYFAGSSVLFEFEINSNHRNCCFKDTGIMNDKKFVEYVVENINCGKYTKLYQVNYDREYLQNDKNDALDKNHATIGFICNNCGVISETPHWYIKSPHARVSSLIGIGKEENKIGRNLKKILNFMHNRTFENKIDILCNSWYNKSFLTSEDK